jgi:hypothetical protein
VNWAEESVKKFGLQKTEAILNVAEMRGLLSLQLKHIMTKRINIDSDGNSQSVSVKQQEDKSLLPCYFLMLETGTFPLGCAHFP